MVVDSDASATLDCATTGCALCIPGVPPLLQPLYCTCLSDSAYKCDVPDTPEDESANNPPPPTGCDTFLGAGVENPKGTDSSNQNCNFVGDGRYIDSAVEPNPFAAFSCAAKVGTGGSGTELVMEALVNAVAPAGDTATCNAGFLRDDAILVVTFITDEADDSAGTAAGWRQALIAAKGNDPDSIVMLGVFPDGDLPNATCPPATEGGEYVVSERLVEFVGSFGENGFRGSICATDYAPFFLQAVSTIDTVCDNFIPPG
jgi:hypothetical protein